MGHLSLNGQGIYHLMGGALWYGWDTYGLNGWGSYDKVSCCFVWKCAQKIDLPIFRCSILDLWSVCLLIMNIHCLPTCKLGKWLMGLPGLKCPKILKLFCFYKYNHQTISIYQHTVISCFRGTKNSCYSLLRDYYITEG